jgi:hypothetical protein
MSKITNSNSQTLARFRFIAHETVGGRSVPEQVLIDEWRAAQKHVQTLD